MIETIEIADATLATDEEAIGTQASFAARRGPKRATAILVAPASRMADDYTPRRPQVTRRGNAASRTSIS